MKKILSLFIALLMIFTLIGCADKEENKDTAETAKKGFPTLNGKDSKEIYTSAIDYIATLKNYEIDVYTTYKISFDGRTTEEAHHTLHKCSGDSFYYLSESGIRKEFFIHDGTMLYKSVNNVNEKINISYTDFMQNWGGITKEKTLLSLSDSKISNKLFISEDEEYYLDFLIRKEEYYELTGGSIESPVKYRVYFDKDGSLTHFERTLSFYYYEGVLVEDNTKIYISNVNQVQKIETPDNTDLYSLRPNAEDIDLSSIESLDLFEATSEITDYVLLNMKIAGTVKISETETVENYEGKILIRLFPDVAPLSVSNFKALVGGSFYNGLTMHRVISDFVIQGGDPNGDGTGGSEDEIFGEFSSNGFTNNLSHKRGVVSLARSNENDSASSQFFICHKDAPDLDGEYASFGYVVYGLDTVDIIAALETDENDKPKTTVTIESATFVQKKQ